MQPLSYPRFQAFKDDGSFAVGWKLYAYAAGTSTPQATYSDQGLTTANTNPVVLDATGSAEIWLNPALSYKLVLTDDADVVQWSSDNVGAHGTENVWLGDISYYGTVQSSNPVLNFDVYDYVVYDRATNQLYFIINASSAFSVNSSGVGTFAGGMNANNAGIVNTGAISGATTAAIGTSLTLGGGTPITQIKVYAVAIDVASVAANTTAEQDFTVAGLTTDDKVIVNKPSHTVGLIVGNARVKAADTLSITFGNLTGSPIDAGVETYQVIAIRS